MTYPDIYKPETVGTALTPHTAGAIAAGHQAGMTPSADDTQRTMLLLVDVQIDFVHEDGALHAYEALARPSKLIAHADIDDLIHTALREADFPLPGLLVGL